MEKIVIEARTTRFADSGLLNIVEATKFAASNESNVKASPVEARKVNPHKLWKITDEDWRNREKWDQYKTAVDEMLFKTSTSYAPWTIVESNCKWYARIKALKTVVNAIEDRL